MVSGTALQFFYQARQLFREIIHGALETGQQVEGNDDGKADGRDRGQNGILGIHATMS